MVTKPLASSVCANAAPDPTMTLAASAAAASPDINVFRFVFMLKPHSMNPPSAQTGALAGIAQAIGNTRDSAGKYRIYGNFMMSRRENRSGSGWPEIRQAAARHGWIAEDFEVARRHNFSCPRRDACAATQPGPLCGNAWRCLRPPVPCGRGPGVGREPIASATVLELR
jgi:hypothetical protein